MSKHVLKTVWGSCLAVMMVVAVCSCSMEPPENGVQIKVTNNLSSDQAEALQKTLKAYDSGISSVSRMTANGKTVINLSPVADAKAYAEKITCGTVSSTEGNVITLDVDTAKIGLAGEAASEEETPDAPTTE